MNYGELKTTFEGLLKRRDMTPTQRDTFISQGINRTQRVLRVPPMEQSLAVTYDGVTYTGGLIPIPADYLRLKAITVNDDDEVRKSDLRTVLQMAKTTGVPQVFVRRGSDWRFGPTPDAGTEFQIDYYAEFTALTADDQETFLTNSASDAAIYFALKYAGDFFIDKRADGWEMTARTLIAEIQDVEDQDALINADVSPVYDWPCDD